MNKQRYLWLCWIGAFLLALGVALPAAASRVEESAREDRAAEPAAEETAPAPVKKAVPKPPEGGWSVYVVPIEGMITDPQFYILRRALKQAIEEDVDVVVLQMNTPGGASNTMVEMMDALTKFGGETITFVDNEAISAGSFIAVATDDIWFSPLGVMGSSEGIMANGQDLPEAMKRKMESYLDAKVRSITREYRYRADVQRAMMDPDYELVVDGQVIKPKGKLLSLTAQEAVSQYGNPPEPLLAEGIADDVTTMLDQKFGAGNYEIKQFEISWIERFSHFISVFGAVFLGLGIIMLGMEFKTPGFGLPGAFGILLIGLFFLGKYGAGLAGAEGLLFFLLGIILIAVEIFLLPGTLAAGVLGVLMIFGALLWSMADIWPEGSKGWEFEFDMLYAPAGQLFLALAIAFIAGLALIKLLPESWLHKTIIVGARVGGASPAVAGGGRSIDYAPGAGVILPKPGARGQAVTDLHPGGQVEIDGRRFQALVTLGSVESGESIEVVEQRDFSLIVKAVV